MFIFKAKTLIQTLKFLNEKFNSLPIFKKNKVLNNEKGMAVLETIPLLVVFMVLMTYAMGFWGTIHASILNSIAARTYAFETFRNRSNLKQFRESVPGLTYEDRSFRFHAINDGTFQDFVAPRMNISFSNFQTRDRGELEDPTSAMHSAITDPNADRGPSSVVGPKDGVNPIWIQIGYGYCLDVNCE